MTKKQRTILFFLMIVVFVVVTPSIILYSQGYRFDVKKLRFVETGAIYLKVYPEGAKVFIDNTDNKETSFFSRDILTQNLLPQEHAVRVEKDGYHSWEKNLEVKVGLATEAKYITLFKKDYTFNLIKEEIENFFSSPDGNSFLLLTSSNEIYQYNQTNKELKKILNKSQTPYNISNIIFSSSNKNALIETSAGLYYLLNSDNQISLIRSFSSEVKNIYFDPKDEDSFIYQINNSIYRLNSKTEESPKLISRRTIDNFIVNNNIIALSSESIIAINDLTQPEEELFNNSFVYKEDSSYQLLSIENYLFLLEDKKNLYFFNKESNSFELKIEANSEIKYTSFFNKILFYDQNNTWLMFLKKEESPFFKEAYSVISLSNYSKKIDNIKWLNGNYFILTIDKETFISEIDNRDNINIFSLDKKNTSKLFFDGNNKKIFLLDQKSFLVSEEKIIP